ncbi:hypothetical protein FJU11_14965 [Pararhizobium mangrovi]|uniref:Uncharacterized protein n=1 Tax=Pararhizobium mangrovi TaxID=2590452 RepID=A0A506U059_9HYPH|nr:hypothetical protein FJU11_14965 [Pararhizobium mangrovi]
MVRTGGLEPPRGFPLRIFVPSTAFAAADKPAFAVWTIPSPCAARSPRLGAARLVSTPSRLPPGLARDRQIKGFPEFEQFCTGSFPPGTQSFKSVASTDSATSA